MARAIWSGSISFGLVNIPVKLYNAVSRKGVSFHQIDAKTGSRISMKRTSSADGREVAYEDIVKGYEVGPDRYVLVEPGELDSLDPEASRTIDIEEFVDLVDIDPIYYDAAYYVAPVKTAEKPYRLLVDAMDSSGKVALARFVMRSKQYLAALRPGDGHLVLSTMVYADEVNPADSIGELETLQGITVSDREVAMATSLIESLSADFEPERYRDTYRDKVLALIESKAAGEEIAVAEAPAPDEGKVVDLMAALEASVREAREARKRHPTVADDGEAADSSEDDGGADEVTELPTAKEKKKAAPKKKPARKSA